MKPEPKRRFRGYAVLDRAGNLVWGTFRTTEAEALATFRKWNPAAPGSPMGELVVAVTITIEG